MVFAYPIDSQGNKIGEPKKFSDKQWEILSSMKGCRFIKTESKTKKKENE